MGNVVYFIDNGKIKHQSIKGIFGNSVETNAGIIGIEDVFDSEEKAIESLYGRVSPEFTGQDLPDKRCGTCVNYLSKEDSTNHEYGCKLGWEICQKTGSRHDWSEKVDYMEKTDGTNCDDWQGKPQEKMRVWTCGKCGDDIEYNEAMREYYHNRTVLVINGCKHPIPKPDSERWVEK